HMYANPVWTALFDYEPSGQDELALRKGDRVEVLSRDAAISGDEGWWAGQVGGQVGIFPSNYVSRGGGAIRINPNGTWSRQAETVES
uniref:Mitogen-activated protein kinase kinase kinase 11,Chimera protein of MLK3-SH3 and MIP n=1 Tax=Homo sapiens TaxID=9606 RepID=UPI000C2F818F|nr:Chain A, Mitogen-activated protein kinase kinase kinase 11,Chimera protein of MLK3-SH3 and MIP [Homo sapiens]5K26_B Chain B, Mitogen-activated protein kinase kinase kinase 11,Chimera protein of MLK3-SH3 and MIP [Homo sapiens]